MKKRNIVLIILATITLLSSVSYIYIKKTKIDSLSTQISTNNQSSNVIKLLGFDIDDKNTYLSKFDYLNTSESGFETYIKMQSVSKTSYINLQILELEKARTLSTPIQSSQKGEEIGNFNGFKAGKIPNIFDKGSYIIINLDSEKLLSGGIYEYSKYFYLPSNETDSNIQISMNYYNLVNSAMTQEKIDLEARFIESVILSIKKDGNRLYNDEFLKQLDNQKLSGSPLGGNSKNTKVTANFGDPDYKVKFKTDHDAIDLVPSEYYAQNNKTYKNTGLIPLFATCNGEITNNKDEATKANYIILKCDTGEVVEYWHNQNNIYLGLKVAKGHFIALMGETGVTENGVHVHYKVTKNNKIVNPYDSIFY